MSSHLELSKQCCFTQAVNLESRMTFSVCFFFTACYLNDNFYTIIICFVFLRRDLCPSKKTQIHLPFHGMLLSFVMQDPTTKIAFAVALGWICLRFCWSTWMARLFRVLFILSFSTLGLLHVVTTPSKISTPTMQECIILLLRTKNAMHDW